MEIRKEAIKYYRQCNNKSETCRKFNIKGRRTIDDWLKNEEKLNETMGTVSMRNRKRLPKERIPKFPAVDASVIEKMKKDRKNKLTLNENHLQMEALTVYYKEFPTQEMRVEKPFVASSGWIRNFKQRNRITSRAVTSVGQKVPANATELALEFFEHIEKLRVESGKNFIIWNMDQMPVYFDSPKNRTLDFRGATTVSVKTTGHEKTRFTLMLCADNTGRKLKPTVIFGGLKKVPKGCPEGIYVMTGEMKPGYSLIAWDLVFF